MAVSSRRPMMAGNWKMFKTTAEAVAFTEALAASVKALPPQALPEILIAPPFTALAPVVETTRRLQAPFLVAAQNMESHESGAYTGEVSPLMLKDLGIQAVLIGHSERRQYYNETDASVNAKTQAALQHSLMPIVCVGETLSQREAGETDRVIETQVQAGLAGIEASVYPKLVIAYEPVWAIGTGKVCDAAEANRVCGLIRPLLGSTGAQTRILYGGSVKPDNIRELMSQPEIDGGLVGGASLEPGSFFQLIQGACLVNA